MIETKCSNTLDKRLECVHLMENKSVRDSRVRGVEHALCCNTCELTSFASAIHRALVAAAMFVLSITTFLPLFGVSMAVTNVEEVKANLKGGKKQGYGERGGNRRKKEGRCEGRERRVE
jgi:hypothetical protein